MNGGVRWPGVGGWSWLMLAISVGVAAAAAVVAKPAHAPGWLVIVAAVVGVIVPATVIAVRSPLEQRQKVAAEHRKLTAGAAGHSRLVRDYPTAE